MPPKVPCEIKSTETELTELSVNDSFGHQWMESVTTVSTAPANCPPETGWTRSVATEGVDDTNGLAELDERRRLL